MAMGAQHAVVLERYSELFMLYREDEGQHCSLTMQNQNSKSERGNDQRILFTRSTYLSQHAHDKSSHPQPICFTTHATCHRFLMVHQFKISRNNSNTQNFEGGVA